MNTTTTTTTTTAAKKMTTKQVRNLLEKKGMAVATLSWPHSFRGGGHMIAFDPEVFGERGPNEEFALVASPMPESFDDSGYLGRGRRVKWTALRQAEEGEEAFFLSRDQGWHGVAGVKTLCEDRDGAWFLVPVGADDEAEEAAWNSLAGLF